MIEIEARPFETGFSHFLGRIIFGLGIFLVFFVPTIGITSGGPIEKQINFFFPWMIVIYLSPIHNPYYTDGHMKILPLWVTLLFSIPSFYVLRRLIRLFAKPMKDVKASFEISVAALLQIFLLFVSYLSFQGSASRQLTFIPYGLLPIVLIFLLLAIFWYFEIAKEQLINDKSLDIENPVENDQEEKKLM
jgi:hypothetical protein